jgi:hypothetical protein
MWLKDLMLGLYEIHKKSNASKAQKKAREVARGEVEARLLSSGVLLEFMDRLERFEILYLDHLTELHKGQKFKPTEEDEFSLPPPPPREPQVQPEAEVNVRPLTIREQQMQIGAALRARGEP